MEYRVWTLGSIRYSPPKVDRIWGILESYFKIPKAIFYLLKGDYNQEPFKTALFAQSCCKEGIAGQLLCLPSTHSSGPQASERTEP